MSSRSKKNKSNSKQNIVKKPKQVSEDVRLRMRPKYKSFRLHKKVKRPESPLPSWWQISEKALRLIKANKRNVFKFFIIYGLLYLVFVRGFSSPINLGEIRSAFDEIASSDVSILATNFAAISLLLQSTTKASGDVAGLYQMFFLVVSSLSFIWLFRQQQAGNKVTMKEAFYRGMYPIIPFILIVILIVIQTIPASVGNFLFSTVIDSYLAVSMLEQIVWFILFILLLLLSAYLISSSLIALMVVTLPEMTPKIALKQARGLVEFRRFSVLRKVLILVVLLSITFVAVVFPALFVSGILAQILFYILVIFAIPFSVAYIFVLYRELL